MASLNRGRFSRCRFSIQNRIPRIFALLAGALCMPGAIVQAEPITFRFDATVTHALAGTPFELPFDYAPGDVISGKMTFELGDGRSLGNNAREVDQFHRFQFVIDGAKFGTSTYSITIFNDTVILDSEPFLGLVDTMTIGCSPSSAQQCMPELISLSDGDPFAITARLELTGSGSVLDTPNISRDSDVWNSFDIRRSISLTFTNEAGGSMLLRADLGQFMPVPEPTMGYAVICILIACLLTRGQPRMRRKFIQLKEITCCGNF